MPYSTDPNDYQRVPIKVAAMAKDFPAGHHTGEHAHERAQLVYAVSGVMRVTTHDGTWVVPTHRAVWVPPGEPHAIRMSGAVAMRTLYIARDATLGLPTRCGVIEVAPLLRELILAATDHSAEPDRPDRARRPDRGPGAGRTQIRAGRAPARTAAARPAAASDLPGADRRSGTRRGTGSLGRAGRCFRPHLGAPVPHRNRMSFGTWRQQVRLIEALARLAEGQSVTLVAQDLGYDSPSAFTAMFRRTLGKTPSRYFGRGP